jgi:hypothetical protein
MLAVIDTHALSIRSHRTEPDRSCWSNS